MAPLLILLACTSAGTVSPDDTATDTATDRGPAPTHLVVTTSNGIEQRGLDGTLERLWAWEDLTSECVAGCNPEGVQPDGDGLLAAYSTSSGSGGVLRLKTQDGDLVPDWDLQDYAFPHDAVSDPSGLGVIVAETFAARILWLDPSDESVHGTLDDTHDAWDFKLPNSLDLAQDDGRTYLLMSNRGNDLYGGAESAIDGSVVLWDITEPTAPSHVWTFPPAGVLGMPHSPVLRRVAGTWVLIYAHTIGQEQVGNGGSGSVGMAWTDDLTVAPTYVGDGVLPAALGEISTTRGVDLGRDGRLYIAETGSRGSASRLLTATLPPLTASALDGSWSTDHAQQDWRFLEDAEVLADDMESAFEPRLWTPTY